MEVGNALCVRGQSANASSDLRLTPEELAARDERELAIAECKAELAGCPLYLEDARNSDDSDKRESPERGDSYYAYE
eukprot:846018-Pleurochrysis_carterae.AAC.1